MYYILGKWRSGFPRSPHKAKQVWFKSHLSDLKENNKMKVRVLLELENKPFIDEKQFEYAINEGLIKYIDGGEILEMRRVKGNSKEIK